MHRLWAEISAIVLASVMLIGACLLVVYIRRKSPGVDFYSKYPGVDAYNGVWADMLFPQRLLNISEYRCPTFSSPTLAKIQFFPNYHEFYIEKMYNHSAQMHILLDGEQTDLKGYERHFDVTVSTKIVPDTIYLPYFIYHCVAAGLDIRGIDTKYADYSARKFAVFAYSNCNEKWSGVRNRKSFYYRLKERVGASLTNSGRCYNDSTHSGDYYSNSNLFEQFKFVIAFENQEILGYMSEKLINPIFAGCIPVYCGAPDVARFINPRRIINVNDFKNFDDVIDRMIKLDSEPALFKEVVSQPALVHVPSIHNEYSFLLGKGRIFKDIYDKAPMALRDLLTIKRCVLNKIVGCTFADGTHYTSRRISSEAERSGYFDEFIAFGKDDLVGYDFDSAYTREKTKERGYGFYTWKPHIILKALLENCQEGDVLIFLDAGSHIRQNMGSVVMEYVKSVIDGKPILAFPILSREAFCTKLDLIDRVFNDCSVEHREECLSTLPYQITSSVLVMRRCEETLKMMALWSAICQEENHRYIDDSRSLNHKDLKIDVKTLGLHVQSILSLLCKKEHQLVNFSYDNHNDHPEADHQRSVFRPKRWKR